MIRILSVSLMSLLLLGFVASPTTAQEEDPTEDIQQYILNNQDSVGIACYTIGAMEDGIFLNADESFPLASTFKILVLVEYAQQVAAGELDPEEAVAVTDIDPYYLPGTDGNAHEAWLSGVEGDSVTLNEIAFGMIRFSSNANTDYLLARLGLDNFPALIDELGLENSEVPEPILGTMLALDNQTVETFDMEEDNEEIQIERAEDAYTNYVNDAAWREDAREEVVSAMPSPIAQLEYFAEYGVMGSPADYARIMAAIYTDEIGEEASAIARDILEWPMQAFPGSWANYEAIGTKGGSLPGILTAAYYADLEDADPVVLTIFYENIPVTTYLEWTQTYLFQVFEISVLEQGCDRLEAVIEG